MGMWNNYKEELDAAKLELAEMRVRLKAMKKRCKKAEKQLAAQQPRPVQVIDPQKQKAENIIQKLAESLDVGGGMSPASKLGSWRAAKTAEYASQKAALTMGNIGVQDPD